MSKILLFLLASLLTLPAFAAETESASHAWEAGKNYFVIDPAVPTASGDRIEVLEIFSYACPHCAHFQPYAEQIKQALPPYAAFDYMPAIFNAQWEPFARAFYTAQSMGVLDRTHQALFDALHRDRLPLRSIEELATFYAGQGVDRSKFLATSGSFEVESKLARAREVVTKAGIDGTPSVVVNGKYRVTGASAGGFAQLVDLVKWLGEKEHAEATAAKK